MLKEHRHLDFERVPRVEPRPQSLLVLEASSDVRLLTGVTAQRRPIVVIVGPQPDGPLSKLLKFRLGYGLDSSLICNLKGLDEIEDFLRRTNQQRSNICGLNLAGLQQLLQHYERPTCLNPPVDSLDVSLDVRLLGSCDAQEEMRRCGIESEISLLEVRPGLGRDEILETERCASAAARFLS